MRISSFPRRRESIFPPPLGEGQGGGQRRIVNTVLIPAPRAPIPTFPQRGKEQRCAATSLRLALSPTLSRKRERE